MYFNVNLYVNTWVLLLHMCICKYVCMYLRRVYYIGILSLIGYEGLHLIQPNVCCTHIIYRSVLPIHGSINDMRLFNSDRGISVIPCGLGSLYWKLVWEVGQQRGIELKQSWPNILTTTVFHWCCSSSAICLVPFCSRLRQPCCNFSNCLWVFCNVDL